MDTNGVRAEITLNIEKRTPTVGQSLGHIPSVPQLRTCSTFNIPEFKDEIIIKDVDARFFDVKTGILMPVEEYMTANKLTVPIPKESAFTFQKKGKLLVGSYKNELNSGNFELKNTMDEPACRADYTLNWKEYKNFVTENYITSPKVIFRGQPDHSYKLRTSFHRCNRNNLLEYLNNDIPNLRHAVNAVSTFYYRENDGEHLGALLSLAQHHGYPTPLLDWTLSPYISAFFAFTVPSDGSKRAEAVRIFVFDMRGWPLTAIPQMIYDPLSCITFHKFPAHNNPRYVPQQSIASFSNVDDMENFISEREKATGKKFLTIIDIPVAERQKAIEELNLMGINEGSLFPGIEGVCRSLKQRYFSCG